MGMYFLLPLHQLDLKLSRATALETDRHLCRLSSIHC